MRKRGSVGSRRIDFFRAGRRCSPSIPSIHPRGSGRQHLRQRWMFLKTFPPSTQSVGAMSGAAQRGWMSLGSDDRGHGAPDERQRRRRKRIADAMTHLGAKDLGLFQVPTMHACTDRPPGPGKHFVHRTV